MFVFLSACGCVMCFWHVSYSGGYVVPLGVRGEIQAASLSCVQQKGLWAEKHGRHYNNLGFTFVLLIRAVNDSQWTSVLISEGAQEVNQQEQKKRKQQALGHWNPWIFFPLSFLKKEKVTFYSKRLQKYSVHFVFIHHVNRFCKLGCYVFCFLSKNKMKTIKTKIYKSYQTEKSHLTKSRNVSTKFQCQPFSIAGLYKQVCPQ